MFPAQRYGSDPDEISRCEERGETVEYGKNLSPRQKMDADIKRSISQALWNDTVLRALEYDEMDVRVVDGIVQLNGHIVSKSSQVRIENALRNIPDILGVKNNLVLDDRLTLEVATSLGPLEHTYACKFFTGASHGVISLNGVVGSEKIKSLAGRIAADHPSVRGVINNVRMSGVRQELKNQKFQQPVIGESIYFLDGVSGIVKQVVINPNDRRVTAMIIQGKFTDPRYEILSSPHGTAQIPEQLVTVPMNTVRYLTRVSGFLFIQSNERTRYLDFDPGHYFSPANTWHPPYPYCTEDVLFPIAYRKAEIQMEEEPIQFPFGAVMEDASVREQFFATDSLGL